MSTLGQHIQAARTARALSIGELAAQLGVCARSVSRWEKGLARPIQSHFRSLRDLLELDLHKCVPLQGRTVPAFPWKRRKRPFSRRK